MTLRSESEDDRWGDFVVATKTVADRAGIDFSVLNAAQFRAERPGIVAR